MDWSQTSEIQAIIVVVDARSYAANVKEASDSSSITPARLCFQLNANASFANMLTLTMLTC